MDKRYRLPDIITGYEVFNGLISFVRPSDSAVNLIKNPRMWTADGYTGLGDTTVIYTHDEQYRGLFSLYCSDSTGAYNGVGYDVSLVEGQKYKFSADVKALGNHTIYMYLDTTGSETPANATYIKHENSIGRWQRVNWEFDAPSTGDFSVFIALDNTVNFYTDGWVVLATDDISGEPEIYFDGDTSGFTLLNDFSWSGGRDTSYSNRRGGSGASGREVFLSDLGFVVQGTVGLGKNPVANMATPLPTGGGYYTNTVATVREISLAGKVFADSRQEFMNIRRKLIDLFKPDRTPVKQYMLMRIYSLDNRGNPITPVLELKVVYASGLEGTFVSDYSEVLQLKFVQYDQTIVEDKTNATEIISSTTDGEGIDFLRIDGELDDMALPSDSSLDVYKIFAMARSSGGELYIGGIIQDSVGSKHNIAKYDGSTWASVDTGFGTSYLTDRVYAIKEFASKYIAFAGYEDISLATIQIYNTISETMTAYPSDCPLEVSALETNGTDLYVGGNYTTIPAVPHSYLATYDVSTDTWSAFDTDEPGDAVRALLMSKDGKRLYVAGDFTQIGSTSFSKVAYYDFDTSTWVAMGGGLNDTVNDLAEADDGTIYACGEFTQIVTGTVPATFIARFKQQDAEWSPLENESLWNAYTSGVVNELTSIVFTEDGVLYLVGSRTVAVSYASMPKSTVFKYVNNSAIAPCHLLQNSAYCVIEAPDGGVYIGSENPSNYKTVSTDGFQSTLHLAYVEVENTVAYPEIHVRGPGNLFAIENHTTKQGLYFSNFQLYQGDHLIIKIDPIFGTKLFGVTSASSYLSAGSDTSFSLTPGINNISISFERAFEFVTGDEDELSGFTVAGLNAENTNNGEEFHVDATYPCPDNGVGYVKARFLDCDSAVLAETSIASPYGWANLSEVSSSGVSGSVWIEDEVTYAVEWAVGLVSVVWKNRRWSISEESE